MWEDIKKELPDDHRLCKQCGKCCDAKTQIEAQEAQEIGTWICKNFTAGQIFAQLKESAKRPDKCPWLKADNSCYIYEKRPLVCWMFGHFPWLTLSCCSGVEFKILPFNKEVLGKYEGYVRNAMKAFIRAEDYRGIFADAEVEEGEPDETDP